MKTITVILPVNNQDMLNQQDLAVYQTPEFTFELTYVNTHLKELNSIADAEQVFPLVLDEIKKADRAGSAGVIVYAFGDVMVKEGRECVAIPVIGLGKSAVHMASMLCRNYYTILPGKIEHNDFLKILVAEEHMEHNYIPASYAIDLSPSELKNNPETLRRLIEAASAEIEQNNIDTFTLGCGCFINVAKPLEAELRRRHNKLINVVDPINIPFNAIKALV